jgi:ATP-dependent helicase HrpB
MKIAVPENLPVEAYLPEIVRQLQDGGALVLAAEPGAGKTSLVPPAVAEALKGSAGKVLVMEPRRVAAVSAAARMAEVWGKKLGDEVGYRVRGESSTSPRARIEAVTPGVLVRMIQSDPGLEGIGCVILDEFHERSAQADMAFALLNQVRELRPSLALLAMSATMDRVEAAKALRAPLLEVPGRSFPITTRHAAFPEGRGFEAALARAAHDLIEEADGDVLVFLPGASEIARAAAEFSAAAAVTTIRRAEAAVLHGSLSLEDQRRILSPRPDAPPRAIFATSVAETSLTVPRVRAVIDSGQARLSRFQSRTGLNRLVTEREAQDRADQRRGRAGRLGPGICLRVWPASEVLPIRTEAEILRAELSGLVLEAALWGAPRRLELDWLDPPPESAWSAGTELLLELGALASDSSPTAFGRDMAALGTEPRLAALVLRGAESGEGWTACLAAALLSERGGASGNDIVQSFEELASGKGREYGSVTTEARRLARVAGIRANGRPNPGALGPLLAAAFPDRIAERIEYRGANASFRIAAGRALRASGPLSQSPWIVALDADAGAGAVEGKIYSACALGEVEALAALEGRARETVEAEWRGLEIKISRTKRVGAIVLGTLPSAKPMREELASLLASRIASEGLSILPWEKGADEILARLRYFAATREGRPSCGAPSPLYSFDKASLADESLVAKAAEWLGPYIRTEGGPLMDGASLKRAVAAFAPRELRSEMDREVPERLELPSSSSRQIDYRGPGGPFMEARVQEFFGLSSHPRVGGVPLVLRLLDPGGKPLQVTSDLPGFWRGSWAQARKELRGRYPKHEWPADPASAAPSVSGIKKKTRRNVDQ